MSRIGPTQRAVALEVLQRLGGAVDTIATGLADNTPKTISNATPLVVEALQFLLTDFALSEDGGTRAALGEACDLFMSGR